LKKEIKVESKFLDPLIVSKLKSLELKARFVVEGFKVGLHKSPYHGFSAEFSQHRPYMQGDIIRNVDWKVFAKTEKYFIKQFEEETNLIANIVVDCSNSMSYSSEGNISKFDYSVILAASLAFLLIDQQDAVGLKLFSDSVKISIPAKASKTHLKTILGELNNISPSGVTEIAKNLNDIASKINKRGLTIIISDFFDDVEEIVTSLKRIHFMKNEVIVFQILDPLELNFGFGRDSKFIDLETGEKISTQPYQIQKVYQNAMRLFIDKLQSENLALGIEYNLISTNTPFEKALFSYFKKRSRLN